VGGAKEEGQRESQADCPMRVEPATLRP